MSSLQYERSRRESSAPFVDGGSAEGEAIMNLKQVFFIHAYIIYLIFIILQIQYVLSWIECLSSPLPPKFPAGLLIVNVTSVVR